MRPPRTALAVLSVLLVTAMFLPAGAAAPPPEGVCGICGSGFERAADENGIDATVGESTLTVRATAEGESHWTATATLNRAAADQFAENHTLLERTVHRTYTTGRTVVDDPENLSVTLDDRTVTVAFTLPDTVRQYPGGVLLFDGFVSYPPNGNAYIDADALTVTGPAGTTITHTPTGGTVGGGQAVWTTGPDRSHLGQKATIAFAHDDGLVGQAATAAAVRIHAFGLAEADLRAYALLPAVLLGLVAAGLVLAGDRLPRLRGRGRQVTQWLAVAGGLYAAVTFLAPVAGRDLGYVLRVVGIGLIPQAVVTAGAIELTDSVDLDTERDVPRIAAITVVAWTLALLLGAPSSALLVLVAGPLAFLPFGVLAGAEHPARVLIPLVAALGPVVAALPFVPQVGLVFVSPTMLAGLVLGTALLGVPLFALGHQMGRDSAVAAGRTDGPTRAVS